MNRAAPGGYSRRQTASRKGPPRAESTVSPQNVGWGYTHSNFCRSASIVGPTGCQPSAERVFALDARMSAAAKWASQPK